MPIKPSIAVVDDDEAVREATVALLRSHGFVAEAFARADDFLNSNRLSLTTCLIADVKMKGISGLELYGRLAARGTPVQTILITAYPDERTRTQALDAGVTGCLTKPFTEAELLNCIWLTAGHDVLFSPLNP
jgi:FixJ family two-component response regulator